MLILRLVERLCLALVVGTLFAFIASTTVPGLQRSVAGLACPSETVRSYVVRVPHDPDPPATVRNRPLVCVSRDGSTSVAAEWRTLPLLLIVGTGGALAAGTAAALGRRLIRGLTTEEHHDPGYQGRPGAPPRRTTPADILGPIMLIVATPMVLTDAAMAWAWLALDVPYTVSSCRGRGGGPATCYDGEPVFRLLTFLFGAISIGMLVVYAVAAHRRAGRRRLWSDLWRNGRDCHARVVSAEPTHTRINGRRLHRFVYEVAPEDGTAPFRFEESGYTSSARSVGNVVAALYDPGAPGRAMTVNPRE